MAAKNGSKLTLEFSDVYTQKALREGYMNNPYSSESTAVVNFVAGVKHSLRTESMDLMPSIKAPSFSFVLNYPLTVDVHLKDIKMETINSYADDEWDQHRIDRLLSTKKVLMGWVNQIDKVIKVIECKKTT